ncbi:hypothetical protein, partial [Vibrio parahaemolyticus]|uniref:hypothetical protein n=1 Tax=Vibrio parahaemolyticus TaxID=670 RepID=UPI001A8DF89D
NLVGDVLRGDIAHLEIAALHGDELGALFEQGAAEVGLQGEAPPLNIGGNALHHLGADVLLREHGGEAKRGRGLRACRMS